MDHVFVLVLMLATIGSIAAIEQNRICDDPEVCIVDEPGEHHSPEHTKNMRELIAKNKKMIDVQELEALDTTEISGDDDNCMQFTTVKRPYRIQANISSNYTYSVVQLQNDFVQSIRWTECFQNDPKKTCFQKVFTSGVSKVQTQCGRKYGAVSLYVYEPGSSVLSYQMFSVPVGCVCRFKD